MAHAAQSWGRQFCLQYCMRWRQHREYRNRAQIPSSESSLKGARQDVLTRQGYLSSYRGRVVQVRIEGKAAMLAACICR